MITAAMCNEMAISVESMKTSPKPAKGFSVLVVDGDSECLEMLSRLLGSLGYKVLTAKGASEALDIAQKKEADLDVVLTEAHLPNMNKFELLEKMTAVSNLPVVIMSDDDDMNAKIGCLFKGAVYYIVKPVTMDNLKNLWQFAFKNNRNVVIDITKEESNTHVESQAKIPNSERERSEGMDNYEEKDSNCSTAFTKRRVIWTDKLHHRFLQAVKLIGIDGARPKKIIQLMNVPGLTRRNVSSHLQKYRHSLRQEQLAIKKRRIRASKSASSQPRKSASTFNFQGEFPQLPNLYSTSTPYQPELRSHFLEDLNSQMPTRPAFGSADIPIHVDSSSNETSNKKYGQPTQSNQPDYTYFNAEHIGPGQSSSNMDLAAGFGHVESFFREDIFQDQNKNFSDVGDFGHQNATDCPILHNSIQQNEQQQPSPPPPPPQPQDQEEYNSFGEFDPHILLSPLLASQEQEEYNIFREFDPHSLLSPLPGSQEQEEHDTFGFERGESDDLFNFAEEDTIQVFDDVDSDDFF
ncbi:two-component response regulator ORR26-like [Rosa sericea]